MFRLVAAACVFTSVSASPASEAFIKGEIVPDVLSTVAESLEKLIVTYKDHKVDFGNELTPTSVAEKPSLKWNADPEKLYSLLMVDPDAPSRVNPTRREWKHWHVVNIPGDSVEKGHELSSYVGSGPSKGTGLHRYLFLIHEQSGKLSELGTVPSTSTKDRRSFKAAKWAADNGLGAPVAGNFFEAQFDDYVPKLHASFTS